MIFNKVRNLAKAVLPFYLFALLPLFTACNEDNFLEEKALDFNSADNSYDTTADFDASIADLYALTRTEFYANYDRSMDFYAVSDMFITADPLQSNIVASQNPSAGMPQFHWDTLYKLIAQANIVIGRLPASSLTEEQQAVYEAKAKFFRSYAYRTLTYLYGDVPLQLEEVSSPKTDFTRTPKAEVMAQAVSDAEFAAQHLPDISDVKDGEISQPAAQMLLAELYLATGQNDKAVSAATSVINNPNLDLMTERFGSRASEDGDVFWDLFRMNNQNRKSGNKESIWVIQFETNVEGGANQTSDFFWYTQSYWAERYFAPQVDKFHIIAPDGVNITLFDWPIGDYTGGRGIGTMYADELLNHTIWQDDFDGDIRNSEYNWPRRYKMHHPERLEAYPDLAAALSDGYFDVEDPRLPAGYSMETGYEGGTTPSTVLPNRFMCGYSTKVTTPNNHPDEQYLDKGALLLSGTAGKTYTDQYMMRLAEAYLLRAEAYVNLGQPDKAAADINVLHERAHAKPCTASQVDIDYILDERLRELTLEEKRRLTLSRVGKLYERITKYNPYYNAENSADGKAYDQHYDLLPIPTSAIEANKDGNLEQNPGY